MKQYQAFLFDFDGTLADSYAAITASVNHVRGLHGLGPLTIDEVKPHVGRGPVSLLQSTVPGCQIPGDVDAYRAHHPSIMVGLTKLLPGADELLARLQESGRRLGLCSNKPRAFSQVLLRQLGIVDRFEIVLGPEDVARPKPAPDMLQLATKRLNLPTDAILYLGDMTVDIQTAREAGVPVWIVSTGSDSREVLQAAKPDRLFHDLREVIAEWDRA